MPAIAKPAAPAGVVAEVVALPHGLKRIPKPDGTVAWYWAASQLSRRTEGFRPRTRLLWRGHGYPALEALANIKMQCDRLSAELLDWQTNPRRRKFRGGFVYFLESAGSIKIGFSTDPWRRRQTLQTAAACPLVLLGSLAGTLAIERRIQRRFRVLRINGEWFRDDPTLRAFIADQCAEAAR